MIVIDEQLLEPVYRVDSEEQLAFYRERLVDVHARLDEVRDKRNIELGRIRDERVTVENYYNPPMKQLRQKEVELKQAIKAFRGRQLFRSTASNNGDLNG